jgi:hypothetical protein
MTKRDLIMFIFAIGLCSISNASEVTRAFGNQLSIGDLARTYEYGSYYPLKEIVLAKTVSPSQGVVKVPVPATDAFLADEAALLAKIDKLQQEKKSPKTVSALHAAQNELRLIRRGPTNCLLTKLSKANSQRITIDQEDMTYSIVLDRTGSEFESQVKFKIVAASGVPLNLLCPNTLTVGQIEAAFKIVLGVDLRLESNLLAEEPKRTALR